MAKKKIEWEEVKTKSKWEVMTDEQIDKYRFAFIKNTLRRASYRWPWRGIAVGRARHDRGIYACAKCAKKCGTKEYAIDHTLPVVRPERGFVTWGEYILNMFPNISGWQLLCHACHATKTRGENERRREIKIKSKSS